MYKVSYTDGRGQNRVFLGNQNREIIRRWFLKNKGGTQTMCSKETGFSTKTIKKHLAFILNEQKI